jgi:hypothetical protein
MFLENVIKIQIIINNNTNTTNTTRTLITVKDVDDDGDMTSNKQTRIDE